MKQIEFKCKGCGRLVTMSLLEYNRKERLCEFCKPTKPFLRVP